MYGCSFSGGRGNFQIGHKTLHNGKAHATSVAASGCKAGTLCLFNVCDSHAPILNDNIQNIVFENSASQSDVAQLVRIGVDNAVGNCLRNSGTDITQFLKGGIQLSRKAGNRTAGKSLLA